MKSKSIITIAFINQSLCILGGPQGSVAHTYHQAWEQSNFKDPFYLKEKRRWGQGNEAYWIQNQNSIEFTISRNHGISITKGNGFIIYNPMNI